MLRHSSPLSFISRSRSTSILLYSSNSNQNNHHSWGYAEVDAEGRTELDKKYEESAEKIRQQFAQPIQFPEDVAKDTHQTHNQTKECDFLIGFSQYRYTMRDVYRKTIALALNECDGGAELLKEINNSQDQNNNNNDKNNKNEAESKSDTKKSIKDLQTQFSPTNIDLTVAWKGRFAMHKFRGCHKVVGVSLVMQSSNTNENNKNNHDENKTSETGEFSTSPQNNKFPLPDTEAKSRAISSLVSAINSQRTKAFIEASITRATPRDVLIKNNNKNGNNTGKNTFTSAELQEDEEFQSILRRVEREIKSISKKNKVLLVYNSQSEKSTMDKLRPIIFSVKVAPVLINIDDDNDKNADDKTKQDEDHNLGFPESVVLPEEIEKYGKRTIILNALSNFYFRSGHYQDVNESNHNHNNLNDYGNTKMERTSEFSSMNTNNHQHKKKVMKFPMVFINGNFFGTASHLLRMQDESKKLKTLIHSPADLKMRPYSKYSI